jgi:hypothetical protein
VLHGAYRVRTSEGFLFAERTYSHGVQDGPQFCVIIDEPGIPDGARISGIYRNGKPHDGTFLLPGRTSARIVRYENGKAVGEVRWSDLPIQETR